MLKKIRISPVLIVMAVIMVLLGYWYECVVYFVTIVMHEFSHAEVSKRLGYSLSSLKLMPYGASLTGEFESAKWSDEVLIALAGPLCNLLIAIILIALWWLAPITYFFTDILVWANIFTAVFNCLPVFPLDGGRIALSLLSRSYPRQKAYRYLRIVGYVFCAVFAVLFVLSILYSFNITFAIIAIFMLVSTIIPDKNSTYQRLYHMAFRSEKIKKGILIREVMVFGDMTLLSMMRQINGNYYYRFTVVDANLNPIETVSEAVLETLMTMNGPDTPVMDAITGKSTCKKNETLPLV